MKGTGGSGALAVAICALIVVLIGCAGHTAVPTSTEVHPSETLLFPNSDGTWVPAEMAAGRVPAATGSR